MKILLNLQFSLIVPSRCAFYLTQVWSVTLLRYCFLDNRDAINAMITAWMLYSSRQRVDSTRECFHGAPLAMKIGTREARRGKSAPLYMATVGRDYVHQGKYRFVVKYNQFQSRYVADRQSTDTVARILRYESSKLRDSRLSNNFVKYWFCSCKM